MKKSLALLNVVFLGGILLSSYLLYTGVAPIIEGKVRVEMQDEDDIDWRLNNSTISADTWVKVINGGNYDITDISLDVWIKENISGYEIVRFSDIIPRVGAGSVYTEPIHLEVDIDSLPEGLRERLVNESTNFTVRGEISARSIYGLGTIKVHYHNTIQWEPLVKSIEIYADSSHLSYDSGTRSLSISVPYFVSTSSLLSGIRAQVQVDIYNGSQVLSSSTEDIPLGQDYASSLHFQISEGDTYYLMTHSGILPILARVTTDSGFSFSFSTEYAWGAPFDGLIIGDVQYSLNTAYLDYSFTNNYTRELDLGIEIVVYDSSDNVVGQSYERYIVYPGEHVDRRSSVSVTGYPSYAIVTVTENISGWSYEMRRYV